ncbi:hypothetical protein GV791_29995 [Nocardia cyriacigeorgica]|jgi:hypothetical protein|uniref:Uncharacterized protein n=2 Tax=Nocardia TaxID=1817 RepID=A0A366CZA1_9NOCA|nr:MULTISPECIES: hypothetical protein [Nocardia]AVH20774.1 hypothetical protein C5B73_04105 [Nocardia cyriacigeorgica]MBF6188634.1 hypothetical protein [Nocardia farcinica]MBF6325311.1 hypothetical protein [Nocardia cyriacigeorgica]MBF6387685.1 hypothetical protein [Nocardia farcinica]MBF6422116.1 hypothetical protein [Nocardia farcinica]
MHASQVQVLSLVVATVVAIFAAISLRINYRKHRVEERERGRMSVRRWREQVEEYSAEIERLGDACPRALRLDYDVARHWLAAEYAVRMTDTELDLQWRALRAVSPALLVLLISYPLHYDGTWVTAVAGVVYVSAVTRLAMSAHILSRLTRRVKRQRMLYARLGAPSVLPQVRPVTSSNPLRAPVPSVIVIDRWITEVTGRPVNSAAVPAEQVRAIQHRLDRWYSTRPTLRLQRALIRFGRTVRDYATDQVRLR